MSSGHNNVIASSNPKIVEKYRTISINIANPPELKQLRSLFERRYSLQELLNWMHDRLKFAKGDISGTTILWRYSIMAREDAANSASCSPPYA